MSAIKENQSPVSYEFMKNKLRYVFTTDYETHRDDILKFWERVNGNSRKLLFDSFYKNNPFGPPSLGLCYDGDKLVGTENYLAQNVSYLGKIFRGQMGVDTLIDPNYRLFHGVFGNLCKLTVDKLAEQSDLLFSMPNEESKKYYLKYFDWKEPTYMSVFKKATFHTGFNLKSILSKLRSGKHFSDVTVRPVDKFLSEDLDSFLEDYRLWCPDAYFYKSSAFLNWKFIENKHFKTTGYLVLANDRPCGYIITHDKENERSVIDFLIEKNSPEIFHKAFSSLNKFTTEQKIGYISVTATPNAWYRPLLYKMAFFKRWKIDYITRFESNKIPNSSWVVNIGDLDVF